MNRTVKVAILVLCFMAPFNALAYTINYTYDYSYPDIMFDSDNQTYLKTNVYASSYNSGYVNYNPYLDFTAPITFMITKESSSESDEVNALSKLNFLAGVQGGIDSDPGGLEGSFEAQLDLSFTLSSTNGLLYSAAYSDGVSGNSNEDYYTNSSYQFNELQSLALEVDTYYTLNIIGTLLTSDQSDLNDPNDPLLAWAAAAADMFYWDISIPADPAPVPFNDPSPTAVPEPATALLLLAGGIGLWVERKVSKSPKRAKV